MALEMYYPLSTTLLSCNPATLQTEENSQNTDVPAQHILNVSLEHLLGQRLQTAGIGPRHLQKALIS